MRILPDILTKDQINYIKARPETQTAFQELQTKTKVDFSLPVSDSIKSSLKDAMGLDLYGLPNIPCRWIRGNTPAHRDRGQANFENTHLIYVTDGEGKFRIGEESYGINAGTGFIFSEGEEHEVTDAEGTSRLLIGPMSEQGFAVGSGTVTYSVDGAINTLFFRNNPDTSALQYQIGSQVDPDGWLSVIGAPIQIENTNAAPSTNILKVIFTTNITISDGSTYFVCFSDGIQFGSRSLSSSGERVTFTIDGVGSYGGLIQNGSIGANGKNHIYIYNLNVSTINSSTLVNDGGWIGQVTFGNGASNNFIVNCSSSGDIPFNGGGIVGSAAGGESGGSLTIRGCSSYGSIASNAGGITGFAAGGTGGSVTCEGCWSEGDISAQDSGGIFGSYAGNNSGYALATKCYSIAPISSDGGGIFGGYAGESAGLAQAQNCYSRGSIGASAGGIFSRYAAYLSGVTTATNCYSSGSIAGYGIYGVNQQSGATQSNCYAADGNWSNTTADTNLTGDPIDGVGDTWVSTGINQPYELNNFGYTPYTLEVINSSSQLVQNFSQTIEVGQSTEEAVLADASGNSFTIKKKSGGDPESYDTITINGQTGAISTTTATVPGTYTIVVRSIGSYNITTFTLTVNAEAAAIAAAGACCVVTGSGMKGIDYEQIMDYRIGNAMIAGRAQNPTMQFSDYSYYVRYKMSKNSAKF